MHRAHAFLLLLAACTSSERSETVDSRLPSLPPRTGVTRPELATPVVRQASYWQWDERLEDENRWPELPVEIPGANGTYSLTGDGPGDGPLVFALHDARGHKTFARELPDSKHHDAAR